MQKCLRREASRQRWTEVFDRAFYKKLAVSKGRAFGRSPQWAKHLIRGSAFLKVWKLFAREKVFTSCRIIQTILKNYPVDDFWRLSLELVHLWCKDESFYFICSGLRRRTDVRQHRNSIQPLSIFLFLYWFGVFHTLRSASKGFALLKPTTFWKRWTKTLI